MLAQKLLWFGLPFALNSFFRQLIPSIDRFFLLHYGLDPQLPQYILAVKVASVFSVLTNAFILAFTPYSLEKLNQANAENDIGDLFRTVSLIAFALIPVLLLFRNELVLFFADSSFLEASKLLPILFFGWVFDLFGYFSTLGIYKSKNSLIVLLMLLTGTVVISALNFLLIPWLGMYGAALAFAGTKLIMFAFAIIALKRHFYLQLRVAHFAVIGAVAMLLSFLVYQVRLDIYLGILSLLALYVFFFIRKQLAGRNSIAGQQG